MLDLFAENPFWTADLDRAEELESSELLQRVAGRLAACGVTSIWKIRSAKWLTNQPQQGHESESDPLALQPNMASNTVPAGPALPAASPEHNSEHGKTPAPGETDAASDGPKSQPSGQVIPKTLFELLHHQTA